jgi:hypothetical protein
MCDKPEKQDVLTTEEILHSNNDILQLSMYDAADAGHLYLLDIDQTTFQKVTNTQHLNISQFSQFAGHLQNLFDHCVTNFPEGTTHAHKCYMR